jgi:hypothetical protein
VVAVAVRLDDEVVRLEEEIDLESFDVRVDPGAREAVCVADLVEALLELGFR